VNVVTVAALILGGLLVVRVPVVGAQSPCGGTYSTRPGDTLFSLAQQCSTTVDSILAANPGISDPRQIPVGLAVTLPAAQSGQDGDQRGYVVRAGDTLYRIAQRFGTTVSALVAANPFVSDPDQIFAGQHLTVSGQAADGAPMFTAVNIPLIATGSGDVGCGDRVVFVERAVEPTSAPLTAALGTLLSLDDRMLGESGLYNPLYQSDLHVNAVSVQERVAYIDLGGQLVLGGVCDNPRVAAQLRQVALQYSTIDDVRVSINGQPLDDLLSGRG
jgi:LysM repeat protein